jgi:hypothetical protein
MAECLVVLGVAAGALQGADGSLSPVFGRRVDHLAHFRDLGCQEAALLGPRPKRIPRDDHYKPGPPKYQQLALWRHYL